MSRDKSNRKITAIGLLLIILGALTFLSLISHEELPNGQLNSAGGYDSCFLTSKMNKESNNIVGRAGDNFNCFLRYKGFGLSSILLSIVVFLWGIAFIRGFKKENIKKAGIQSLHIVAIMIFYSIYSGYFTSAPAWSGQLGSNISDWLFSLFGSFGMWLIGIGSLFLYATWILNVSIYKTLQFLSLPFIKLIKIVIKIPKSISKYYKRKKEINVKITDKVVVSIDTELSHESKEGSNQEEVVGRLDSEQEEVVEQLDSEQEEVVEQLDSEQEEVVEQLDSEQESLDQIQITDEERIEEVNLDDIKERKAKLFNYKLPTADLLDDPDQVNTDISEEVLRARGEELIDALFSFGVQGEIVEIKKGPVITLYEIEPAEGVRVNKFTNLSDDLARVMKAQRIRVLAPIPGTKYIGIELPNETPQIVYLKTILNSKQYAESESRLTIGVGKTTMGNEFCFDLQKMPHLLVAGATGAGKSVCINTIIVSILYKAKPDEVKFILIDPKKLELATYKSLVGYHLITAPDLDEYVMTTAENAVGILDSAITEMERRFELFADARVRNIQEYHKKQELNPSLEKIPYIVVLIDELADLMMTSGRAVEDPITRLAQKARAVGLHLVVATQRPSVDVITGLIKSNFPARISFQVSSKIDSRTILDQMGAETLLGRGDMLFLPPGSASPVRLHNAYVTLEEIEGIMNHISNQSKPEELLLPERKKEVLDSNFDSSEDRDELLFDAAKLVIQNQQASVSLLQRKFKIGYSRAGRLVDELEALGIVSGYSGSKARDVLVDESYLDKIFN